MRNNYAKARANILLRGQVSENRIHFFPRVSDAHLTIYIFYYRKIGLKRYLKNMILDLKNMIHDESKLKLCEYTVFSLRFSSSAKEEMNDFNAAVSSSEDPAEISHTMFFLRTDT